MPDDRNNPGPEDGKLISLIEDHEVTYWTKTLNIDRDKLKEAVEAVGHSAQAVRAYLEGPRADDTVTDYEINILDREDPTRVDDNPPCGDKPIQGASS